EHDALLDAVLVEEAELDHLGHLGEDREVRPRPVEARPQRIRAAGPDVHHPEVGSSPLSPPSGTLPREVGGRMDGLWGRWRHRHGGSPTGITTSPGSGSRPTRWPCSVRLPQWTPTAQSRLPRRFALPTRRSI